MTGLSEAIWIDRIIVFYGSERFTPKWPSVRLPNRGTARSRARIITSQLPLEHWHAWLQDPTLADAILDRLAHQAHKLPVKGDSMRRNTKFDSADA